MSGDARGTQLSEIWNPETWAAVFSIPAIPRWKAAEEITVPAADKTINHLKTTEMEFLLMARS